mmetsp:Transcript_28205/g.87278  ORF Transcript_28205/g.87278 Transcript_28205/m.87278 type:complete len:255 (-) Transcript_28205:74-838(-)
MEAPLKTIVNLAGDRFARDVVEGLWVGKTFCAECLVLELLSFRHVIALWTQQRDGARLWLRGLAHVLLNMFVFTPLIFAYSVRWVSDDELSAPARFVQVLVAMLVHSVGYYSVHRAMHTPALYWCHKFHHRFNRIITPLAANAVTPVEYSLAYAIPFTAYARLLSAVGYPADRFTIHAAIWIIGFTNLLIHTPDLEPLSKKLPAWLVGTHDHFEHHRKLAKNYAAPTFNLDTAVRQSPAADRVLARWFGKAYLE